MSLIDDFLAWFKSLFGPAPLPITPPGYEALVVARPKVMVINFDPIVDAQGARLTEKMGWSNVDQLIAGFIADIDEVSHGLVKYQYNAANRVDVDAFPVKADGFQYTAAAYLSMLQHEPSHHEPDSVDYWKIIHDFNLISRITNHEVDEIWLFGGPYFGFWESHMVGKGAIWCNSAPLANSELCAHRFIIMGFNYQRGAAEMIHNVGHRMESIMAHVYDSFPTLMNAYGAVNPELQPPIGLERFTSPRNDFERLLLYEKIAPGRAGLGLIHTPPNAQKDYDWSNQTTVSSDCDDWLNFPERLGTRRMLNCSEWCCSEYEFIKWWFKHIPHASGSQNGILNNWWRYTMQVDLSFRAGE